MSRPRASWPESLRYPVATPNDGAANSARFVIGPETGLVCDVNGILFEISPSVGIGGGIQATNSLAAGPAISEVSVMAGGVARVSITDRLHVSLRGMTTMPDTHIQGNARSITMLSADADIRLTDRYSIGLNVDGTQYLADPAASELSGQPQEVNVITGTGVFSGTF